MKTINDPKLKKLNPVPMGDFCDRTGDHFDYARDTKERVPILRKKNGTGELYWITFGQFVKLS